MYVKLFPVAVLCVASVWADCSRSSDIGNVECHLFRPYYNKYQWATCLTNVYIQTKSGGHHICRDHSAIRCYYQCMIEVHDKETGDVTKDCTCGSDADNSSIATTNSPMTSLPNWCYSPDGTDCRWYSQCLEKRYPCQAAGNSYALSFGLKFCNIYEDHKVQFDAVGQRWIDAVRKCLQVSLVPLLRPFASPTCDEIKRSAFDSHPGCYVNATKNAPSICDIGLKNWLSVLTTIHSGLDWKVWRNYFGVLGEDLAIAKQGLMVGWKCLTRKTDAETQASAGVQQVRIVATPTIPIETHQEVKQQSEMTYSAVQQVNLQLPALDQQVLIYPVPVTDDSSRRKRAAPDEQNTTTSNINVDIMFIPRDKYDLNYQGDPVNSTDVVNTVLDNIESGSLRFQFSDGIQVKAIEHCADYECQGTTRSVVPPPVDDKKSGLSTTAVVLIVVFVVLAVIVAIGVATVIFIRKRRSNVV